MLAIVVGLWSTGKDLEMAPARTLSNAIEATWSLSAIVPTGLSNRSKELELGDDNGSEIR